MHCRGTIIGLATLGMVWSAANVSAQDYPDKPVTVILSMAAGSGPDVVMRMLAERLGERLGQTFIIENRPGSAQLLGITAVKQAPADGYTLGMSTSAAIVIRPSMFRRPAYDPLTDFTPIANYVKSPFVLVVNPDLPVSDVPELVNYIRENAGDVTFASSSVGGPPHLAAEFMAQHFGLDMTHVPYRNSPQAFMDIAAGFVPLGFADLGTSLPLIRDGRLKPLAVSSLTPLPSLPQVPTFAAASGAADFEAVSWHLLFARAEVPRPILNLLHAELAELMHDDEIVGRIAELGLLPQQVPAMEETQQYIRAETEKWGRLVNDLGLGGTL